MAKSKFQFTEELFQSVISRISSGETLRAIARDMAFNESNFRYFVCSDDELATRYARAREMQAESWADGVVETAENCASQDYNKARLIVDTKKWLMAKLHPRTYGDKSETTLKGDPNAPLSISWQEPAK